MKYVFHNPGQIRISKRTKDHNNVVNTTSSIWVVIDGGVSKTINWDNLGLEPYLKELFKGFIFHRLETVAPRTVQSADYGLLKYLQSSKLSQYFPWKESDLRKALKSLENSTSFFSLKKFYRWGIARKIDGFSPDINLKISEVTSVKRSPYGKIFLRQITISNADEIKIIRYVASPEMNLPGDALRDSTILQLAYELGPRAIQIHSLDIDDLFKYSSENTCMYSINLPMAKKIKSGLPEKKPRSISITLGEKIEKLISLRMPYKGYSGKHSSALFQNPNGIRLSSEEISFIVSSRLKSLGFNKGEGLTTLRHHLAQSIADSGGSAEIIAEILGHNSLVPARAYVGATPTIAEIKTKALGKNGTYLDILSMLLTGNVIEKKDVPKERWVKGTIGNQYIGGIGSCGLSSNTPCPKNPVYSCYTCKKFHPFIDGPHGEVKLELEKQAQAFIDTATKAIDIEHNRTVTQLGATIQAVNSVIIGIRSQPHK